jgi:hypothetical protein
VSLFRFPYSSTRWPGSSPGLLPASIRSRPVTVSAQAFRVTVLGVRAPHAIRAFRKVRRSATPASISSRSNWWRHRLRLRLYGVLGDFTGQPADH